MELRIREVDEGREEKKKHRHGITRKNTEKPEAEERTSRSIATELHGKTRNQNAQAEERLDLRIREGDEGASGGK